MSAPRKRTCEPMTLRNIEMVPISEVFRLGALRDGIRLATTTIQFPILGQVVPRIELEIGTGTATKKITVRINQESPFVFTGKELYAEINGSRHEVPSVQYVDPERAPTGMYNFGLLRENGIRSFVFDYHTYCAYSCDFCFKESEWEILAVERRPAASYSANFDTCMEHVSTHAADFRTKYDIVWLCTGSIRSESLELERHCKIASALRDVGYTGGIYVSQVIPPGIRSDRDKRLDYLEELRSSGVSRFNSGVEIVNAEYRRKYIRGYKGDLTFDDYVAIFRDAVEVFGHQNVGSCLLAGIEPAADTIHGLDTIAKLGVVPSPTVLTPFIVKQSQIPFEYDLDALIKVHVDFNEIIDRYELPVFSGVFSLA